MGIESTPVSDTNRILLAKQEQEAKPSTTPDRRMIPITGKINLTETPEVVMPIPTKTHLANTVTISPPPPTLSPTPYPFSGRLFISKVMYNPVGDEPENEWFEIYNPDNIVVEISYFKIGDEETPNGSEGMLIFPENSFIESQQTIVIANHATAFFARYSKYPTYEITESEESVPNLTKYTRWSKGNVNLSNENDEVLLLDGADNIIDKVAWEKNPSDDTLPVFKEGSIIERMPAIQDTNTTADWVDQIQPNPFIIELNPPTPSPQPVIVIKTNAPTRTRPPTRTETASATLTPSPTSTETPTPTSTSPPTLSPPGRIVLSEVLFYPEVQGDPTVLPDLFDEWIEIYNSEDYTSDLTGICIGDAESMIDTTEGMYSFPENSTIPGHSYLVIAYYAQRFRQKYHRNPDFEFLPDDPLIPHMILNDDYYPHDGNARIELNNEGDEVVLLKNFILFDAITWGYSTLEEMVPSSPFAIPTVDIPPRGFSIERVKKEEETNTERIWQPRSTPSPGY